MKTLKQIIKEIANVSAGYGVRGFGEISGTPKVGDEDEDNPHIERVIQGAKEHNELVRQFVQGAYKEFDNVKHNHKHGKHKNDIIQEEDSSTVTTTVGPGMGDNPTKEVFPGKTKKNKPVWPMFRRLPLQLEEIGGIGGTVGGTSVGTGYIAGTGHPLEGKPSNWGEPGVQPKDQLKKKKKVDDPRMFGIFRRKSFTQYLKERQK